MKRLVIDGDLIAYAIAYVKESNESVDIEYLLNSKIRRIFNKLNTNLGKVFISGIEKQLCYRHSIATIQEYKGNRDKNNRPKYINEVKRCMLSMGAISINDDLEVDDYLAIEQNKDPNNIIICSLDKDLKMIKGDHYDWNTDRLFSISKIEAYRHFFTQLLTGDRIDNIKGLSEKRPKRGIGLKRALKLLSPCHSYREMLSVVKDKYHLKYGDTYSYKHWKTGKIINTNSTEILLENANLLWIKRTIEDYWCL